MKHYLSVALLSLLISISAFGQFTSIEFESLIEDGDSLKATGVLVDKDGTVATVVLHQADPQKATILGVDGKKVSLELLAHDRISRMTLYRLPQQPFVNMTPVGKFADAENLKAGDVLHLDLTHLSKHSRMVSMVRRFNGRVLPVTFIRANISDEKIAAGSPVFNEAKELVGLAYQPTIDQKSFYILPAKVITHLKAFAKFSKVYKPSWIGVSMDHLGDAPRVIGVRPEAPAKKAGLKKGDIIISVDGVSVTSYPETVNAFYFLQPGKSTKFKIIRGVELLELSVIPEVNPIFK